MARKKTPAKPVKRNPLKVAEEMEAMTRYHPNDMWSVVMKEGVAAIRDMAESLKVLGIDYYDK